MTDLRKAAEMALDALRLYVTMYPQMDKGYMVDARETLRQALTQPEFDTPESHIVKWSIPVDPNNFGEAFAQPEQEPTECGYDETVGMCTNNPCCEQTPVAHLWECIGRWSAYLASNREKANLAPPEWLVDAVKAATVQPEPELTFDVDGEQLTVQQMANLELYKF